MHARLRRIESREGVNDELVDIAGARMTMQAFRLLLPAVDGKSRGLPALRPGIEA